MDKIFDAQGASLLAIEVLTVRLAFAIALGALLAWRPLSRVAGAPPSRPEIRHALLLMTVASALVIVVIGDSLARAFGVVGLGSFVRFRTTIKDPGDIVLFFLAIGVGMACGLGFIPFAAAGVAIVSLVLVLRDRSVRESPLAEPLPGKPVPSPEEEVALDGRMPS
jgi:uncharacterized membrane protein YhiD involved in acid resistance